MLVKILIAIVIVVLGLAAFIATRPDEFEVSRSATFAANFIGKAMSIVFDFDKTIGADFEAGLASMKTIVEK